MTQITVVKRSGRKEPLNLEKWQAQVAKVCQGIADVSQSMIEIKSQPHFFDGISTREIDEITLRAIVDLIDIEHNPDTGHTNYQYVAGKHRLSMLRKDVYGQYEPPHLYEIVQKNVSIGLYTPELLEWYSEDDWNKMESFIDHTKDEQYSFAAIEQLIEKYLLRNRATKEVFETPQVRYMVAAATVFHKEEPNSEVSEGGDIVKFISKLLESREMAQVYHWTVKGDMGSHAAHLALEAYYSGVIELIDELVEVYQGQYGLIEGYDTIDTSETKSKDKLDYYKEVVESVRADRKCISAEDTHLHNIVDEIVALLYKTIYKLTYNK